MWLVLEIQNGDNQLSVNSFTAEFVGPDGTQQTANQAAGNIDFRPGSSGVIAISFPASVEGLGGTAYVDGYIGDFDSDWEIQVPMD